MSPEDPDRILTTTEAARLLGVATSTVQLWMESGAIASWKTPGGHRRTHYSDVRAVIDRLQYQSGAEQEGGDAALSAEFQLVGGEGFPMAADEAERLLALARLKLVDTETEERFDRIVRLAAHATQTPIALVSLLTAKRQWFKARVGLAVQETPREWAFCSHAILRDEAFIVEDASADERFRTNPLVLADPSIRFYAGIPIRDREGRPMGTLCVIDREPRKLRRIEREALEDLAAIASCELAS